MRRPLIAAVALLTLVLATVIEAQTTPAPPSIQTPSIALVVTYADGRISHELVSEQPAWVWSPNFPRTAGAPARSGLEALRVARVRVGNDARVTVSMLSGPGLRTERIVTTVTVSQGTAITVDQLRAFGAEPIVLSLIDAKTLAPFVPSVVSVSPEIEVSRVELLTAPAQGYRITVRNVAPQAVALFSVQSYRGTEKALSRVVRGDRGRPAIAPDDTRSFDLPINVGRGYSGAAQFLPEPLDVIEIDEVLWEDGSTVGRHGPNPLNFVTATDGGRRIQFERALQVLRATQAQQGLSASDLLSLVRQGFQGIPESDDSRLKPARQMMQATRALVLRDLETFPSSQARNVAEVRRWIQEMIAKYEAWVRRLAA